MRTFFIRTLQTMAMLSVGASGALLSLEIQSSCLKLEEVDREFEAHIFPPMQDLSMPSSSSIARGQNFVRKRIAKMPSFDGYSISNGSVRNLEQDELEFEQDELDEDELDQDEEEISRSIIARMDCPLVRDCPCKGCPGHWCLVLCGLEHTPWRRLAGRDEQASRVELVQQSQEEEEMLRGQESFICSTIERLLSTSQLSDTCLSDAIVLSCRLS